MASLKSSGSGYSAELDETERASRDEIMPLQTRRLAWSLKHAYDNVAHYRAGKQAVLGWFVGQVMKATSGRANPKLVNELLRKLLDEGA